MNCNEARRMISETLDGAPESASLSRHLAGCAACARARSRSLNLGAALGSLTQRQPSAALRRSVLAAVAVRRSEFPAAAIAPVTAALAASSALLALAAARVSLTVPQAASAAAKACAWLELGGRLALSALPAPRAGAEFALSAAIAAALFLTISMPRTPTRRLIGAKP